MANDWSEVEKALTHIGTNTYSENRSDPSTGWQDLAKTFATSQKNQSEQIFGIEKS